MFNQTKRNYTAVLLVALLAGTGTASSATTDSEAENRQIIGTVSLIAIYAVGHLAWKRFYEPYKERKRQRLAAERFEKQVAEEKSHAAYDESQKVLLLSELQDKHNRMIKRGEYENNFQQVLEEKRIAWLGTQSRDYIRKESRNSHIRDMRNKDSDFATWYVLEPINIAHKEKVKRRGYVNSYHREREEKRITWLKQQRENVIAKSPDDHFKLMRKQTPSFKKWDNAHMLKNSKTYAFINSLASPNDVFNEYGKKHSGVNYRHVNLKNLKYENLEFDEKGNHVLLRLGSNISGSTNKDILADSQMMGAYICLTLEDKLEGKERVEFVVVNAMQAGVKCASAIMATVLSR